MIGSDLTMDKDTFAFVVYIIHKLSAALDMLPI